MDHTDTPYALSAPPAPETGMLKDSVTADVALVGAGFSGLIAARDLARRGLSVVLIEAAEIGAGGSGRNRGQCIPVFDYLDRDLLPPAGFEMLRDAGRLMFDDIAASGICCEAVQAGTMSAAHDAAGLARAWATHKKYRALGKAAAFLSADEVEAHTGMPGYLGGWVHVDGGHINPLAYARGLARTALAAVARIYTQTPLTGLTQRDGLWQITTPLGEVRASRVGLCVNGYGTADIPARLRQSLFRMRSYGVASAPLTAKQRAIVMPQGMNFGDTRRDPMFFRVDAQGRIITGGLVEMRRGRSPDHTFRSMNQRFGAKYPVLADLQWEHLWQGTLGISLAQRPFITELNAGLWALGGYSGRGVPTSAALGRAFGATLANAADGARLWPHEVPPRIMGGDLLGLLVQTGRGPLNKLRDRLSARSR